MFLLWRNLMWQNIGGIGPADMEELRENFSALRRYSSIYICSKRTLGGAKIFSGAGRWPEKLLAHIPVRHLNPFLLVSLKYSG
jgi:hypothetical protein